MIDTKKTVYRSEIELQASGGAVEFEPLHVQSINNLVGTTTPNTGTPSYSFRKVSGFVTSPGSED